MESTTRKRIFLLLTIWAIVTSVVLWSIKGQTPNLLPKDQSQKENPFTGGNREDLSVPAHPKKTNNQVYLSNKKKNRTAVLHKEILSPSYPPESHQTLRHRNVSSFRRNFLLWENATTPLSASIGPNHVTTPEKYLIYRCDSGSMSFCGGWADRVKGVLLTYVIANLTGRLFKVEILDPPCNILNYVVPNLVDWSLPVSIHDRIGKGAQNARAINKIDSVPFLATIPTLNFTNLLEEREAKYIYFKANLDYSSGLQKTLVYSHQLSWMAGLSNDQIMSTLYKRVFKLSPYFHDKMNKFMELNLPSPRHRLICAHVRMGANPTIPRDSAIRFHEADLAFVWKFLSQQSKTDYDKIFLMSDSENAVRFGESQPFANRMVSSVGPINHIDKSGRLNVAERCGGLQKVIFDQHVLMQCDVLLVCLSGLSRMAAYVRGSDQGLYCLLKKGKIVPCKVQDIKKLYKVLG